MEKDSRLIVRASKSEIEMWEGEAKICGLQLSVWVRQRLNGPVQPAEKKLDAPKPVKPAHKLGCPCAMCKGK